MAVGSDLFSWQVSGRLVYKGEPETPLHNMELKIGHDLSLAIDPKAVHAMTDSTGRFRVNVPFHPLIGKVYMQVIHRPWELKEEARDLGARVYLKEGEKDFGDVEVDFWGYLSGRPGLKTPGDSKTALQSRTTDYELELVSGAARFKGIEVSQKMLGYPFSPEITQSLFPANLTLAVEKNKETKGATKTPEWTGRRILDGFCPTPLLKGKKEGVYGIHYDWNRFEFDKEYLLPNIKAKLVVGESSVKVVKVAYQWRKASQDPNVNPPVNVKGKVDKSRLTEWTTIKEGSPEFARALKIFRTAYLASGEIDEHLGAGHLNVEQYAVAAFRNLRKNPLKCLLFPHLRDVVLINDAGSEVIFGPTGALTTTTALTSKGVDARLKEKLGHMDWKEWAPRKPLTRHHLFAKIENLYWDVVKGWVDYFIETNKEAIKAEWKEVLAMSSSLVAHSVPYKRLGRKRLDKWADISEIDASSAPRSVVNGKKRAVRPITEREVPQEDDLKNLKEACSYMIFFSTLWHSWVHNHQLDDLGNIDYGVLGMKEGGENPNSREVVTQLTLAHLLTSVNHGFVTKNENKDIDPEFIRRLKEKEADFKDYGINLDTFLRSCINI